MRMLLRYTLAITFFTLPALVHSQISFGLKAGAGGTNNRSDDAYFSPKVLPSFQLGGLIQVGISKTLQVESGLLLINKGYKLKSSLPLKTSVYPVYLQIPLYLLYTKGVHFIGAGPYVAFGIGGNFRSNYRAAITTRKLMFGDGEADDFAKKDAGISFQAGRSFRQARLGVGLDWELSNNVPRQARSLNTSLSLRRHRVLTLFYSYVFCPKPSKEPR